MSQPEQWHFEDNPDELYERYLVPAKFGPWAADLVALGNPQPGESVLDVACGGGDVAVALWKRLDAQGLRAEIHGCDVNPLAVEHAAEEAERQGAEVSFFQLHAIDDTLPSGYDVVMSSLFLHHLSDADAEEFLRKAADAAGRMVLIHDLVRGRAGYLLAYIGVRALLCNDVCHEDGPRSVEGAFTIEEAKALAEAAGLEGCSVKPKFPFRFLLAWRKP